MNSQNQLHSENFELCRVCLLEPESNRQIRFLDIFSPDNDRIDISKALEEFLQLKVEKHDVKPKIICQDCYNALVSWIEMKKQQTESQIILRYIEKKRFSDTSKISTQIRQPSSFRSVISHTTNNNETTTSTSSNVVLPSHSKTGYGIQNSYCSSSSTNHNHSQSTSNNQLTELPMYADQTSEADDDTSEINMKNEMNSISEEGPINMYETLNDNNQTNINYCSICKANKYHNHDCSRYNKEFSTCLIPNCNVLSRSMRDFIPHYRRHLGLPAGVILCRRCWKENKKSEQDENGCHNKCYTQNLFKCYSCLMNFNNMAELALHKLKIHQSYLINLSGNYLCFYCENSYVDRIQLNEHIKYCLQNQGKAKNVMKVSDPGNNILKVKNVKNKIQHTNNIRVKNPCTKKHALFTCIKPSCKLIFQNFQVFKFHHREHFNIGSELMCWQCCSPFPSIKSLRAHQGQGECRTPGFFKCDQCPEQYETIQNLSIHKLGTHVTKLLSNYKNKKPIPCSYCQTEFKINDLKAHLKSCQPKKVTQITSQSKLTKKVAVKMCAPFKCQYCPRIVNTAAALTNHTKSHFKEEPIKNTPTKKKVCESTKVNEPNEKYTRKFLNTSRRYIKSEPLDNTEEIYTLPSTSQRYVSTKSEPLDNIEEIYTLPSTSQGITRNINETHTFVNNETDNDNKQNMPADVGELYPCPNCPKKFSSQKGMRRHCNFSHLKTRGIPTTPVKNYYCIICQEYFIRLGFYHHMLSVHEKKLTYQKHRRYTCSSCTTKFVYKLALQMHKEHKHGETQTYENLKTIKITFSKSPYLLPVISSIKSLAQTDDENTYSILNVNNIKVEKENDQDFEVNDHTGEHDFILENEVEKANELRAEKQLSEENKNAVNHREVV